MALKDSGKTRAIGLTHSNECERMWLQEDGGEGVEMKYDDMFGVQEVFAMSVNNTDGNFWIVSFLKLEIQNKECSLCVYMYVYNRSKNKRYIFFWLLLL